MGNLLTRFAGCCKPLPGDDIKGYITLGHGVSVHRTDCPKLLQLQHSEPQRVVQVDWGQEDQHAYPVDIVIEAFDRQGLLRDITMVLADEKVDLISVNTSSNKASNTASMQMTVEVPSIDALGEVLAKIIRLPNILSAKRISEMEGSEPKS